MKTTGVAALLWALAGAALAQSAGFPVAGPPDWSGAKLHADRAQALAGEAWPTVAAYFCSPGVRVNAVSDPAIEPVKLFDDLWALGDEGTVVYAVKTPAGLVLIDALYPEKLESVLLPQMAKAGLDPAEVKYVLITHGHADHFGGAGYFQQKYGARVALSAVDWDAVAKANLPAGRPAPKRDIEVEDGKALRVGGVSFTPVFVPGHTPGSLGWIFPVTEDGKAHMAGLMGSTILRNDRLTADNLNEELQSWRKWGETARAMKVDVELQNHPLFDLMPNKLEALAARRPGGPNPFVVGQAAYGRYTATVQECLMSDILKKGGKPAAR